MLPRGVNLPWRRYGGDFGANAWSPAGGLSTRACDDLERALDTAAAAGAEVIRWFVLTDGRAGITFDASGSPERLQPVVLDDMGTALDLLGAHGLRMVPVLFDFTWADAPRVVNGVSLGGRAPVLRDAVARHALWCAVDTLIAAFGRHPAIAMWDLWNEPDWMIAPWRPPSRRFSPRRLRQYLAELALHVRWHATHPLTVGLASARGLPLCRDLSLDVLQVHWYDHLERRAPLSPRARVPWSEAPLVLGEFPTSGSARAPDAIAALARDAGYAAAWPWSLHADDRSSNRDASLQALAAIRDDWHT
ncbi:Endo-beta-mannanase [Luteitalea pratensis]|uniref:Endo-beta-mannanase n=1 Tax=Luteitalea pratensis TaxID=1855912 RepID=A0A143PRY1_LUTPR|nr:hypothetical protein [Luteitalea pratensis]AMY11352.1 Endo-beta-mannanase [Luteitalea pratensis]